MVIDNIRVFDLDQCVKASKYPMSLYPDDCNVDITNTVKKLASCPKGTGHDQFLTGITVNFDLTCTNKMWVELQRYKFVNFVSSQSTMHRLSKFKIKEHCIQFVDDVIIQRLEELQKAYLENSTVENFCKMIYNIPSGFELTARLTTNYRALKTIYSQRKNHRLPEWRVFCEFIEKLPNSKELIIGEEKDGEDKSSESL